MKIQRMTKQEKELIKLAFTHDCSIDTMISITNNRSALQLAYESVICERETVEQIITHNFETPVDYYERFSELYSLQINDGMIVGL